MPAPDEPTALPVTFRPVRTRVVLLTVGSVMLITFATVALAMPAPWAAADRATMIGTGLIIFAVLALLSRPKVVATRDGVTVVNLTTVRRLAWAEVLRVNLRAGDPWVYLDLADGTSLAAMGIQPGIARQQAVSDARRLRALADALGTGPADAA
ncbi:PH domain-containing protein [Streptomyces sp. PTM05]|uniref:PH domain-containing protein n=2 Tax=Streptantibioticus parmotrematis TaxID=2873249 RepID=A0ABS7QN86_9ACTN|nr:PH domain-containing protein [Streptantibioticus parmotrematis]MBY8884236.1 PH domain-containing protein [Streptantibioticus parmotrematis]